MRQNIFVMNILFLLIILTGCSSHTASSGSGLKASSGKTVPARQIDIINVNHHAGSHLLSVMAGKIPEDSVMLLATFVNLDNLSESSTLGRIIPQQIATRFTQCGYEVVDVRLRSNSILIKEKEGEFALSRRLLDIARDNHAQAILVGTYSVVFNQVLVNAKVLRSADGMTMAAVDYELPYDRNALRPEGFSGAGGDFYHFVPNVFTSIN